MDRTGDGTDDLVERDHELRSSLYGIEAAAMALNEQRDRVPSSDVDQLVLAIASEARRLRLMLERRTKEITSFDLAEAIRPAVLLTRSLGVTVCDEVPTGMWVQGCRDDLAQVMFGLLDNARIHAPASPVDVRVTLCAGTTTLFIEDRGPGIAGITQSSGSGLGLFIARRLMVAQAGSLTAAARPGGGTTFALSLPSSLAGSSERLPQAARHPEVVR